MAAIELILLCQSEIDDVYRATLVVLADEEVVRLDIAVNEALRVDILDSLQDLQSDHDDGLEWKTLVVLLEERLQGCAQHLHYHYAFLSLSEVLVDLRY